MIRIKKLYTFPEITDPIFFENGLNIILGEPDTTSNKTNGVGKSMSIEFLNFCLLRKKEGSRVLKIPKNVFPLETIICLDVVVNEKQLTIKRSIRNPDSPTIGVDGKSVSFDNVDNATKYLNDIYYGNDSKINLFPSFRELINPLIRDERSEFKDIVSYFDTKTRVPSDHTPTLYLLNFDMAAYRLAKSTIKEIDDISKLITDLRKSLTQNSIKTLPDVRAEVNSLDGELKILENDLEQLKTYQSFEKVEDELVNTDISIDKLKVEHTYLKSHIQKIRSLPKIEKIDEEDVMFVYNQFIDGLGDKLKKSFDQVNNFKNKIENFQNQIVNDRLKTLLSQFQSVSLKLRTYDEKRSELMRTIDKEGIFKDLKQSLAIYHLKSEESSLVRTQLKRYDSHVQEKNRLKSNKSTLITKIDKSIKSNEEILLSFNKTISDIHEKIMGNRACSFNIKTVNRDTYKDIVQFEMTIDYGGSHSVERVKVFIYDLALMLNYFTREKHPNFLIHDNIFDVDQDTLIRSLNYLHSLELLDNFQYILTLTSDKFDSISKSKLNFDLTEYTRASFTKSSRFIKGNHYSEI